MEVRRHPLLGVFKKLRKATINFVIYVRPSACNISAHIWPIWMEFDICRFLKKHVCREKPGFIKSDENDGHFKWRPTYIYDI